MRACRSRERLSASVTRALSFSTPPASSSSRACNLSGDCTPLTRVSTWSRVKSLSADVCVCNAEGDVCLWLSCPSRLVCLPMVRTNVVQYIAILSWGMSQVNTWRLSQAGYSVSYSIDWAICVDCTGQAALVREIDGFACTPHLHNLALQLELLLLSVHQLELCT